jgi:hypothetical protein
VLAKKALKDELVRRAALTEPIAIPPTNPMSKAIVRYLVQRRWNETQNQYQATRTILEVTTTFPLARSKVTSYGSLCDLDTLTSAVTWCFLT